MLSTAVQILITILGSGAVFSFIQFLITRHDTIEEKSDKKIIEDIRTEYKQHLTSVNDDWKEKYCNRNYKMINDLTKEVREGLDEREERGLARYNEHRETINELKKAVLQLVDNNTEIKKSIDTISDSLVGLSHDKILHLSDQYLERGAITLREKSTIKSIYEPYRKLGGNGDCEVAYNYICKLPVVSEEEAKQMDKQKGEK